MNKFFLLLACASLLVACSGEDVDIETILREAGIDINSYSGFSSNTYTKPGSVINVTANSVTIGIERQSAERQEYMVLIPEKNWKSLTKSDDDIIIPIPNKTDTEITITDLEQETNYYCFQTTVDKSTSTSKYDYYSSYDIGDKYIQFTTGEREVSVKISSIKKIGLHHVVFNMETNVQYGSTYLCYSFTNSAPTANDYIWNSYGYSYTVEDFVDHQTYYVRPYIKYNNRFVYGDVEIVKTDDNTDIYANAVDLGLSVKWADRPLLAKEVNQSSTYVFNAGTTDYARNNWGGKWRTPTKEEIEELQQLSILTTKYGSVEGVVIRGKSGTAYSNNSIFIPNDSYWTATEYNTSASSTNWNYFYLSKDKIEISYTANSRSYKIFAVQDR